MRRVSIRRGGGEISTGWRSIRRDSAEAKGVTGSKTGSGDAAASLTGAVTTPGAFDGKSTQAGIDVMRGAPESEGWCSLDSWQAEETTATGCG